MDIESHGPWVFLVAFPVFVIFSFRAFFLFSRGRKNNRRKGNGANGDK
jgi:hypothetical protein